MPMAHQKRLKQFSNQLDFAKRALVIRATASSSLLFDRDSIATMMLSLFCFCVDQTKCRSSWMMI